MLAQTLPPSEVVISEDGSNEETSATVEWFRNKLGRDKVIYVRNNPPRLQLENRRQAFKMASGEFVAMLDDDDEWEPEFLEQTYQALVRHPECAFCSTDHWIMDSESCILPLESEKAAHAFGRLSMTSGVYTDVLDRVLDLQPFSLHTTLFRRTVLESVGFIPPYGGTVPDFGLFLAIGAKRANAYYVARRLGRYRIHQGQQTAKRLENAKSKVDCIKGFVHEYGHCLSKRQYLKVRRMYRLSVVELAVAYGHMGDRASAFKTLARCFELGPGILPISRLFVLALLAMGVTKDSIRSLVARD